MLYLHLPTQSGQQIILTQRSPGVGIKLPDTAPLWSMREHLSIILKAELIKISIHRLFVLDVRSTIVKKIDTVPALQSL